MDDLRQSTRAKVVAVAYRDEERLRHFAPSGGSPRPPPTTAPSLFNDVDILVTACTTAENVDLCLDAVQRGKHVVSVKPFAMNLADADRLASAVRDAGVLFMSFDALYRPPPRPGAKEWTGEGRIGTPISATAIQRLCCAGPAWTGRDAPNAPHLVARPRARFPAGAGSITLSTRSTLRWLLEDEVQRVSGVACTIAHPELPKEIEDCGVALFEFRKAPWPPWR